MFTIMKKKVTNYMIPILALHTHTHTHAHTQKCMHTQKKGLEGYTKILKTILA